MVTPGGTELAGNVTVLVRGAQAGSRHALTELVSLHLPLVYNLVGRALNGHPDVDDVVQDTMVRVVGGLPTLREPDRFRSWLVAIAYRQIQRYRRERARTVRRTPDVPLEPPDPSSDFAERTVSELMLTGQRQELAEAARWLDDGDRELHALWWQEATGELTRGELADVLGVKPQHAAVRLHRLKARLDSARAVVRALRARPRCHELAGLLRGWSGVADPLWRKRLTRHTRDCARCAQHRLGLVAPEDLLLGVSSLPLPVALAEGLRIAFEATPAALAPAGQSVGHWLLAHIQGFLHNKAAVAATAVTVAAGGGFAYAVYERPAPDGGGPTAIESPAAAPRAVAPQLAPPAASAAPPATPTPRAAPTGVTEADVYVAPDGSDSNDGSLERPYATVEKAVGAVQPGQTIALRDGSYLLAEPVVIEASGEPERRITLSNYRDERPVIDASQLPADKWAVTQRASYWTVQGLEIMNSRSHAYVCRSCRDNVFQRLSIHDNARSGLTLRDDGTTGNRVLDSDFFRNYDPSDGGRSGVGLAIKFGSGTGNLVRGCRAFHNADSGFDIGHFDGSIVLEYNWAYGNGVNRWDADGWQSNADGFLLGGGSPPPAAAHLLRHNAAWDNVGHGFSDGGNRGALELGNNTAFRNGGDGFHLPAAAAVLRGNAAIGNDSTATLGGVAGSDGNTWDGGDWDATMFGSTDPATAQGPRRPDGRLPETDFLTSGTRLGASMSQPS
jgi:RNA polymerase sigma factor (sigma-70 family)